MRPSCGQQAIRYDQYRLSFREWTALSLVGTAACGLIVYTFYRSWLLFLLSLPIGLAYPFAARKKLMNKRLAQLNVQFKEGALILSSLLSAGYSIENAFENSTKELKRLYGDRGLITMEFAHITQQVRMNRPVEQVLWEFARRSGLDDVKNFASVFASAKRSGGELVSVIGHTVGVIQDKMQVQEEILTLTSAKRLEQKVMNMIPFFIVIYIDSTSPGFFSLMYGTGLGRILMTVCLAVYLAAYWMSERILMIEV